MSGFPLLPGTRGYARLSPDGAYRYVLSRRWDEDRDDLACFVMLNPSTADADRDDLTLRKCQEFARRWGMAGCTVVNLYALRSSAPRMLRQHPDPEHRKVNDSYVLPYAQGADRLVVAWGGSLPSGGAALAATWLSVFVAVGLRPYRIGPPTLAGQPKHPSRLPYSLALEPHGWVE